MVLFTVAAIMKIYWNGQFHSHFWVHEYCFEQSSQFPIISYSAETPRASSAASPRPPLIIPLWVPVNSPIPLISLPAFLIVQHCHMPADLTLLSSSLVTDRYTLFWLKWTLRTLITCPLRFLVVHSAKSSGHIWNVGFVSYLIFTSMQHISSYEDGHQLQTDGKLIQCFPTGKSGCCHQAPISHSDTLSGYWGNQPFPYPINAECQTRMWPV